MKIGRAAFVTSVATTIVEAQPPVVPHAVSGTAGGAAVTHVWIWRSSVFVVVFRQ